MMVPVFFSVDIKHKTIITLGVRIFLIWWLPIEHLFNIVKSALMILLAYIRSLMSVFLGEIQFWFVAFLTGYQVGDLFT